MTSRKIIVLLIIFSALLAYVYFFEIQGEKRKQAQKEQEELLINLDKEHITGLSFLPGEIIIERDSIVWRVTSPVQSEADESTIESILDAFSWLKKGRLVSDIPDDFRKFGLNPYQYALVIEQPGSSDTLLVGDANLDNTNVFYRNSGSNNVYLVPTTLKNNVTKTLFDLRDKSIVSFEPDSVTEIMLQSPGFTFHCHKDSAQKWLITQPDSGLAKSGKILSLFYDIKDIEVAQFIDEPYKSDTFYEFDRPEMKLTLKTSNSVLSQILIGKEVADNIYLKNNLTNKIYFVKKQVKDNLSLKTEEFIDKQR